MEIERPEYEEMIAPWIEKTLTCVHQSLTDARLLPKDVDKVMLVGGSTRTPLVHRLLETRMQLEPRFEINPDLIVAMGAAIQGAMLAGEKHHSILVDITPHTFSTTSISRQNGMERLICVPIIPRNTPLPSAKAEMFETLYDDQDVVKVDAYQGENPVPEQNTFIGEFRVEGLSSVPAGNPVLIRFELDLNGLLTVTATEKATGLSKTVTMDTRGMHVLNVAEAQKNIASLLNVEDPASKTGPTETASAGQLMSAAGAGADRALQELKSERWREALWQAERSWSLAHQHRVARLAFLAATALGDRDSALIWRRRASSSSGRLNVRD